MRLEKEKQIVVPNSVTTYTGNRTKLTPEEIRYAIYAVQREAIEESTLFVECRMLLQSDNRDSDILQKLLGIPGEKYNQLINLLDEHLNLQESEWPELLKRHGLYWEKSDFSKQDQKELQKAADRSRREAEVETRFRVLMNGRKEGFHQEDYKKLIDSKGYLFSDFEHLLDKYGDKFMGRLVRKFFEREEEQAFLQEWRKQQRKSLPLEILSYLCGVAAIGFFYAKALPAFLVILTIIVTIYKMANYEYETI